MICSSVVLKMFVIFVSPFFVSLCRQDYRRRGRGRGRLLLLYQQKEAPRRPGTSWLCSLHILWLIVPISQSHWNEGSGAFQSNLVNSFKGKLHSRAEFTLCCFSNFPKVHPAFYEQTQPQNQDRSRSDINAFKITSKRLHGGESDIVISVKWPWMPFCVTAPLPLFTVCGVCVKQSLPEINQWSCELLQK